MSARRILHVVLIGLIVPTAAGAAELPGHYFKVMQAELKALEPLKSNPGAMFAAAVLYAKQHAANLSFGDKHKLELSSSRSARGCSAAETAS
jgi:hypothetical protein